MMTPDTISASPSRDAAGPVRTWDPLVRLFHWSLVATVGTALATGLFTAADWIDVHVWAGAAMAGLVGIRLAWGFLGGRNARFSGFVTGPRAVLAHLKALRAGEGERHLGHNPAGAVMIVALLAVLAGLAVTGLAVFGGVLKSGPLAWLVPFETGWSLRELHEVLAYGLIALIGLHLAGTVFESIRTRENLARAMMTGTKEARPGDHAAPAVRARPLLAGLVMAALLGAAGAGLFALAQRPAFNVPTAALDPVYADECGACHMAYHPSLLPRQAWEKLLAGLGDHFGEDASLPDATLEAIRTYVMANAAEAFDTKPAHMLARINPDMPFTLTATRFWQRVHGDLPAAVFKRAKVGAKGNCQACHRDAESGLFYPGNISIPKE
ncbi:cytochrome b/b6 domain-containing protein [Zhengella mangrovi]|nr:cytochrome b/b6 domain-containing protein [Zhengella mangrovi]